MTRFAEDIIEERSDLENFVSEVAELFGPEITDMSQLDAADFKDKARNTWYLVQQARKLKEKWTEE